MTPPPTNPRKDQSRPSRKKLSLLRKLRPLRILTLINLSRKLSRKMISSPMLKLLPPLSLTEKKKKVRWELP